MADMKIKLSTSQTFATTGASTTLTLANIPDEVTEVKIGSTVTTTYSVSGNVITFTTAPSGTVTVTYTYWSAIPTVAGEDGKSAYDGAVEAGYQGSEAEFYTALTSLGGEQPLIKVNGILKGDGAGNITNAIPGSDYLAVNGNAVSASKLASARNIIIGNATKAFDGTAPITYTLAEIGAAPVSHNQAASTITAGTLGGQVVANASAVSGITTKQVRNISAGTTDMTPGVTALASGDIYVYYKA